jgi:adenosylcobinamide-GDP ribazoletransferase
VTDLAQERGRQTSWPRTFFGRVPEAQPRAVSPLRGFISALQFLTRLPVPAGEYSLEAAFGWFPVVGFLLGALLALADLCLRYLNVASLLENTMLVVLLLMLNGALHADGLMDTADAAFGHATPERRLEIMRDPRAGAFGVTGLICVVVLKIAALGSLGGASRVGLIVLAPALARWSIIFVATLFPYGRTSGLGAPLKAAATPRRLLVASIIPLSGCALLGPIGMFSGAIAALIAYGLGRWLVTLLPGLTGDCYGAVCEVVETVVWVGGAIMLAGGVAS